MVSLIIKKLVQNINAIINIYLNIGTVTSSYAATVVEQSK